MYCDLYAVESKTRSGALDSADGLEVAPCIGGPIPAFQTSHEAVGRKRRQKKETECLFTRSEFGRLFLGALACRIEGTQIFSSGRRAWTMDRGPGVSSKLRSKSPCSVYAQASIAVEVPTARPLKWIGARRHSSST